MTIIPIGFLPTFRLAVSLFPSLKLARPPCSLPDVSQNRRNFHVARVPRNADSSAPNEKRADKEAWVYRPGRRWTKEEDERLLRLKKEGLTWVEVAGHFEMRSVKACTGRHNLLQKKVAATKRGKWRNEEDEILLEYMMSEAKDRKFPWVQAARLLHRAPNTIRSRWERLQHSRRGKWEKNEDDLLCRRVHEAERANRSVSWQSIAAELCRPVASVMTRYSSIRMKNGKWSEWEDLEVKRLVSIARQNRIAIDWRVIGRAINRPPGAVYTRWHNFLDSSLLRGAWKPSEDATIIVEVRDATVQGLKPTWAAIAKKLKRGSVGVRDRWRCVLSKRTKENTSK